MKKIRLLLFMHFCISGRNDPFSNPFEITQNIELIGIAKGSKSAAAINIDGTIFTWNVKDGNSKWELTEISADSVKLENRKTKKSYLLSL